MSKTVSVFTIIIVTASISESQQQIVNLLNTNFKNFFGVKVENDEKNNRGMDEISRRDQGERELKQHQGASSNVNEQLHGLENLIHRDLQYNRNEPQSSLLQSQIQKPDQAMHVYNTNIFFPEIIARLENNTSAYSVLARKRHPNPSKTDESLRADGVPRLYDPMETGIKHVYIEEKPAPAVGARVKRDLRNPKDYKKKRERKKKAQKRRKKRKKERMIKHARRQQRQQANKLKRIEKMKLMGVKRQNRTKITEKKAIELADPQYDEVYEMSFEEKTPRPDSDEEYKHYLDPIPATDEMSSDDWRHVKYSIREKNSSECEPAWFDDIDIDNMTDSELNRRFPTEEEEDMTDEDYSSSISKKIKKIQDKQIEMVNQGKDIDSQNEESYSDDSEEGSGSDDYEEEGSGSYDDDDYGSDDYDKDERNKPPNKNEQNKDKTKQNKNTKGMKTKDKCKNGHCDHEEHKIKENHTVRSNIKSRLQEKLKAAKISKNANKKSKTHNIKKKNDMSKIKAKNNILTKDKIALNRDNKNHAGEENKINTKHKNLIKTNFEAQDIKKHKQDNFEKQNQINKNAKHKKAGGAKNKNEESNIQLGFVGLEKPPKSSREVEVRLHDSRKQHNFARV